MNSIVKGEIRRIRSLKRFRILVLITFLGALGWTIYNKAVFFNDFIFTIRSQKYSLFVFNLAVGVIVILSQYMLKFTKQSILFAEGFGVKRGTLVLAKWRAGISVIFRLYVLYTIWILLLGLIFGAHNSAFQIKVMITSFFMDMVAVMGCYTVALFLLFLTAFPLIPIIAYFVLIWLLPVIFDRYGARAFSALLYTRTRDAYSAFILGRTDLWFIPVFVLYTAVSLILSVIVFGLKKKERKKLFGKKEA